MLLPTSNALGRLSRRCLAACLLGLALPAQAQITWDFATATPTSGTPANLTVSPVTQGNNFTTVGSPTLPALITSASVSSGYAGASGTNNGGIAARIGALDTTADKSAYFEVTLTPAGGFQVALNSISFGSRRTGTGPTQYTLRSSADGYVANVATGALAAASTWAPFTNSPLALTSATPLTLRLYGHDGAGNAGAGTANWRIDDLVLNVTVTTSGGPIPTITSFTPTSGAAGTAVTITGTNFGAAPTVSFNGTAAPGATVNPAGTSISVNAPAGASTGNITVVTSNGSVTSTSPYTFPPQPQLVVTPLQTTFPENGTTTATVSRPNDAPTTSSVTVSLSSSNTGKATVPASVVIPVGDFNSPEFTITGVQDGVYSATPASVTITATATGFTNGTSVISVTNVDPAPPSGAATVVVNKFFNSGTAADTFELLVIGSGSGGAPVDMRGMILKDFSGNMVNDGGGKYVFKDTPLLSSVKVGTLLVIDALGTSSDTTYSSATDFSLRLALADTNFFTKSGTGTFDISLTDMVMIKSALTGGLATSPDGVTGGIHVLGSGTEGTKFTEATCAKLIASSTTGTGLVAIATNPNSTLADFNGTGATGGLVPATVGAFGVANNPSNNGYIRSLRGITTLNGVGVASISNGTSSSPFNGRNIFGRGLPGQTVSVSVLSDVTPSGTLTRLSVDVPPALGTPSAGSVTVTGAGAGTPVISVSGQTISVTGTAATTANPAIINIGGLTTPSPTGVSADGRYPFTVSSAGPSGSLAPLAIAPAAVVIIPIESLRDVDVTGIPNDINKIVAVEGVVTAPNFNTAQLSAFIQNGNFGMNVFNSKIADFPTLTRGNRIVVTGKLIQFAGLTEINPSFAADLIDLGPGTPPAPLVVTAAALADLSNPAFQEGLEGRLITVSDLSSSSGTWTAPGVNPVDVVLTDANSNLVTVRISLASTATSPPATFPASITGILSQSTLATDTLFVKYILLPRDPADVVGSAPPSGYTSWAAGYGSIGTATDDFDKDSQSNFLEYCLGTDPTLRSDAQQPNLTPILGKPSFRLTKGSGGSDPAVVYTVEGSTNLQSWTPATNGGAVVNLFSDDSGEISAQYLGTSKTFYFRLKVGPPVP